MLYFHIKLVYRGCSSHSHKKRFTVFLIAPPVLILFDSNFSGYYTGREKLFSIRKFEKMTQISAVFCYF